MQHAITLYSDKEATLKRSGVIHALCWIQSIPLGFSWAQLLATGRVQSTLALFKLLDCLTHLWKNLEACLSETLDKGSNQDSISAQANLAYFSIHVAESCRGYSVELLNDNVVIALILFLLFHLFLLQKSNLFLHLCNEYTVRLLLMCNEYRNCCWCTKQVNK